MNSNFNRVIEFISKRLKNGKFEQKGRRFSHSELPSFWFDSNSDLSIELVKLFYLDLEIIQGEDEFGWKT